MRRVLALVGMLALAQSAQAAGLLIPVEKKLSPLAMFNHQVNISIEDQVAVTKIEQTFRNHTDNELEATYVFPVPKGASVRKFSVWSNGKEVPGELVEADKARKLYTDLVQRTLDPALLEYMGHNMLRVKVYPIKPKADQKIMITYTSVAENDKGLVEYVYPLKTDGKSVTTLDKFSINVNLKSQHPITNIYSPSHAITIGRPNDKQAQVGFEKQEAALDRDFQLFYGAGDKDVGLTALTHRPFKDQNGYFMLLASPRAELSKDQQVPRDMVLVLDTSGSMRGKRMTQARNALKYCLANLGKNDRFALINFSTAVNKYTDKLLPASAEEVDKGRKWVDGLEAAGGTAIDDALSTALSLRPDNDEGRTFTIVFFTDGQPTIGETNTDKILANVAKKNSAGTRIFTLGVGDDVNASMLDKLAEDTRALSTYVRESEDIENRVSSLFSKISNPVLANLKLSVGPDVKLSEIYPTQLPDLFHGSQLVVLGRYTGKGHAAIKLTGNVGKEKREFVYEINFADKTADDKGFVEDLWARRKVGYLLDQIRLNGEKKELVDEVVTLAKRYGITTPYTSYLIMPDGPVPVVRAGGAFVPQALAGPGGGKQKLEDFAKKLGDRDGKGGGLGGVRGEMQDKKFKEQPAAPGAKAAMEQRRAFEEARALLLRRDLEGVQAGRLGVDLSVATNQLRSQTRVTQTASRQAGNRTLLEVGGLWIDEGFDAKMETVAIKAMSKAYFDILERQPQTRDVFRLGNHLIWVTPSGTALIVDQSNGREELSNEDIDRLFKPAPQKSTK